jgi:hypothetical protein
MKKEYFDPDWLLMKFQRIKVDKVIWILGLITLTLLIIVGFGVGSWLISVIFGAGLDFVEYLSKTLHFPLIFLICLPILILALLGFISRRRK